MQLTHFTAHRIAFSGLHQIEPPPSRHDPGPIKPLVCGALTPAPVFVP
jgi:hypothetical protein